jgi:hypothetical protein
VPPALVADAEAEALMAALERNFRAGPRVVRMDIRTSHQRRSAHHDPRVTEPSQKTLWGIFDGDSEQTNLLYVFSGPGRLAGTTLLMHDRVAIDEPDAMWLYLRSFDIFKLLEPKTQQVMVPGTALSYEDSRGFIPRDKYRFTLVDTAGAVPPVRAGSRGLRILGCPRTATTSEHLGYRSILLGVDVEKQIVLDVAYTSVHGRPLKTYTLVTERVIGERYFPAEVRLEHLTDGFVTQIGYEYWIPETPPAPSMFEPTKGRTDEKEEENRFVDRLRAYLTLIGEGKRIDAELEKADEQVRAFEERLQRIRDAEREGRKFRE